jgi:long-chain acyl-CoA synthetase
MGEKLWLKSYVKGVPEHLEYEETTISQGLTRSAQQYPDKIAMNYMGRKIDYRTYDGMVNRFARALMDQGIKAGDKVAVCLPNIPQAFIANMAIFRIGAVTVQNNPLYTERELAYQLNDSDAKMIVTLTLLVPRIEKIKSQTKIEKIIACHIHSYLPFPKKQLFPLVKKDMVRKVTPSSNLLVFKDIIDNYSPDPVEEKGNGTRPQHSSTPAALPASVRGLC